MNYHKKVKPLIIIPSFLVCIKLVKQVLLLSELSKIFIIKNISFEALKDIQSFEISLFSISMRGLRIKGLDGSHHLQTTFSGAPGPINSFPMSFEGWCGEVVRGGSLELNSKF